MIIIINMKEIQKTIIATLMVHLLAVGPIVKAEEYHSHLEKPKTTNTLLRINKKSRRSRLLPSRYQKKHYPSLQKV